MKTVLFYINAIHQGGAERVMVNLLARLSERGYKCILVTSFKDTWEYPIDSRAIRINLVKKMNSNFIVRNVVLIKKLRRVIRNYKPDVVISFMAEPNFRLLFSSIGLNTRKIISVRNDPEKEYKSAVNKILAKELFKFADHIVFQTQDAQKWFPSKIQNKSSIIFNQVDERFFSFISSGERHDIVSTGRLVNQKNYSLLISAFAKVSDVTDDKLIIYGEGIKREELERQIADEHLYGRVLLPGQTEDVIKSIGNAKLFVLSSDYEGMPNSLLEALAMGLACISTDCPCGGPKTVIDDGIDGILVPINDVDLLADAMRTLLLDNNKRLLIGENGRTKARLLFNPDIVLTKWIDIIEAKT